jgi:cellulose synthase/poly-beta-1,6-N-acetylglucosamine synthase-like glycosyltransferase
MPSIIFFILVLLYFILIVIYITGVKKRFPKNTSTMPSASVIVCARNEEDNILTCLQSLSLLEYPKDKLEIILVDDHSTDKTGAIIDNFIKERPAFRKVIPPEEGTLKGKTNALAAGIKQSSGEIILTTDADCTVQPGWINAVIPYYFENTGMVAGYTILEDSNWFQAMQQTDLLFLLSIGSGTANIGKPITGIGNNLSFARKAYDETGGYENIPFSVTEDYMLMKCIAALNKYEILFPCDPNMNVFSKGCANLKELIHQKKRWAAGAKDASVYGIFVLAISFLNNLGVLLVALFFSPVWLYLAVFKCVIDYYFLAPACKKAGVQLKFRYFILFEIYYLLYVVILPIMFLFNKNVLWKGRKY